MNVGPTLLIAGVAALVCASALGVIAVVRVYRDRAAVRYSAALAPYRMSLIALASGEDDDGLAHQALSAVPERFWLGLRPSVMSLLPKVRGIPAQSLGDLMRERGEIDAAVRMLKSHSTTQRARAAYLLGLVRDPGGAKLLLPLLNDESEVVRLAVVRALGVIGDPGAARGVLSSLRTEDGKIAMPASVAAEALSAMGPEIGPVLQMGLASTDAAVRHVSALVAGQGAYLSTAPQLRVLLAEDSDDDVRISAALALGRIGGAIDVAVLLRHTGTSESTELRRTCATALGDLGQRESLDALTGLLADDDRRLADLAADALVRIGSEGIAILGMTAVTLKAPGAGAAVGALRRAGLSGQRTGFAEQPAGLGGPRPVTAAGS